MIKQKPILAFLLSLVFTGLGQVYNGDWKKGILFLAPIYPIIILLAFLGILESFSGFVAIGISIICYKIAIAVEAYIKARKLNAAQEVASKSVLLYLSFLIGGGALLLTGAISSRYITGYNTYRMASASMEPNLLAKEAILFSKIEPTEISHGDIVSYTKDDALYIGRLIGLPGDTIEIINDRAVINGEMERWTLIDSILEPPVLKFQYSCEIPNGPDFRVYKLKVLVDVSPPWAAFVNMNKIVLGQDEVFILGDNRNVSLDSRLIGTIPISRIDKKAKYIWWSSDFSRIGTPLSF